MILIPVRMMTLGIFAVNMKVEEKIPVTAPDTILVEMVVDLHSGGGSVANQKFLFHEVVEDRGVPLMTGWLMVESRTRRLTKA